MENCRLDESLTLKMFDTFNGNGFVRLWIQYFQFMREVLDFSDLFIRFLPNSLG